MGGSRKTFEKSVAQQVGANVRSLREGHGWSAKDIGDALGVTADAVFKMERGVRKVSAGDIVKLAYLFGVSSDRILFGPGPRPRLLPLHQLDLTGKAGD